MNKPKFKKAPAWQMSRDLLMDVSTNPNAEENRPKKNNQRRLRSVTFRLSLASDWVGLTARKSCLLVRELHSGLYTATHRARLTRGFALHKNFNLDGEKIGVHLFVTKPISGKRKGKR